MINQDELFKLISFYFNINFRFYVIFIFYLA